MLKLFFSLFVLCANSAAAQTDESLVYLVKYDFKWQKDSTNPASLFTDMMNLEIREDRAIYYSYFKQIGVKNGEEDMANNKPLTYAMQNGDRYYANHESEIIINYYPRKKLKVIDRLSGNAYYYWDTLTEPVWEISQDTATILDQLCQKATTQFKGRHYTAWFTHTIPYSLGPWQFTGLPGLILRVKDDKSQFVFECIQLAFMPTTQPVFKEYPYSVKIAKYKIRDLKRLRAQDYMAFMKADSPNLTITSSNSSGVTVPVKSIKKPYNPIDLSQ